MIQIIHFGFNHKICLIVRKNYNGKAYVNAYLNYVPSISKAMGMWPLAALKVKINISDLA